MNRFFARAGGAFGANMLSAGLTFGLHIVLARVVGEAEYGIYAYVLTWIVVVAIVVKLGFDTALVRFVPEYRKDAQWGLLKGIVIRSRQVCMGFAVAVSAVGLILVWLEALGGPGTLGWTVAVGLAVLPVLVETHLDQAILRGLQEVPKNELPDRVIRPAVMLVVIALAVAAGLRLDSTMAMGIHLCALLVGWASAVRWMNAAMPAERRAAVAVFETRAWLTTAVPLAAVSGMYLALANIDVVMLGSLVGTTEAGIYSVAARVAVFVIFALTAVNAIAAPVIAENFDRRDQNALQHVLTRAARLNFGFAVLVALVLATFGRTILGWFGPGFVEGYWPLVILCCGHVLNAACGTVGSIMTMTGHERTAAIILLVAVVVNVVGNFILIPVWGMIGAAMATAGTTGLWNLTMLGYTWRRLGINASVAPLGGRPTPI